MTESILALAFGSWRAFCINNELSWFLLAYMYAVRDMLAEGRGIHTRELEVPNQYIMNE